MRTFDYAGFDIGGRRVRGLVEADSPKAARECLAAQGVFAERLTPVEARRGGGRWNRGADRAAMYRELAALLQAGLPFAPAIGILIDSPEWAGARTALAGIRDRVRDGATPADAIAAAGASRLEIALLQAGQRAGALADSMRRIAEMLEEEARIRDRIRSAMIYPLIVCVLALGIAVGVLGFLLPSFARMFEDARVPLPTITRAVLAAGRWARATGPLAAVGAVVATVALRRRLARSASARVAWERFLARVPGVGGAREALVGLRFARVLSLLLRGGIPLIESLPMAAAASGSAAAEEGMAREVEGVRHGGTLRDAIRRIEPLRSLLAGWIEAGEQSGDVPAMLDLAAARCEEVWNRRLARALALIEPLLIMALGGLVFVLALAILLPILNLHQQIG